MTDSLKQAISTYNKIADIYSKYIEENLLQFQLAKFESLLKGKKILDAACAAGRDSEYFVDDGFQVTGVDFSEELIKKAKKRTKAEFVVKDLREIKYKEKFDGVWSMRSLLHCNKVDCKKILINFNNALKKEGILFLSAKEGSGSKEVKKEEFSNEPLTYYHYSKQEFEDFIKEAGFKVISSEVSRFKGENWLEIFAKKNSIYD